MIVVNWKILLMRMFVRNYWSCRGSGVVYLKKVTYKELLDVFYDPTTNGGET